MIDGLSSLCTDFYVNQKVALKLDLPTSRETVLHMFDRVRKELPAMDRFRRAPDELSLESAEGNGQYNWLVLNRTAIRSGWVNPESVDEAYRLHRMILETAPYYLSISPLDVEYIELLFGFDIESGGNRNGVVFDALLAGSPLGDLVEREREQVLDAQPMIGFALTRSAELRAYVEVRTRPAEGATEDAGIVSVYLTVRRIGPFRSLDELVASFGPLAGHAERLADERVLPGVVMPIRDHAHPG